MERCSHGVSTVGGGSPMSRKFGLLERWAKLYAAPTPAELALEPAVAALGIRYRAQHPVFACGFILDFALLDDKIAIEVDGPSHRGRVAQERDKARTEALARHGWTVVRCSNEEALLDPAGTLREMLRVAKGEKYGYAD